VVYHQSNIGHLAPDGRVVMRRSTNRGRTWSEPREILNESDRDVFDPSVIYNPESEEIIVIAAVAGFAESVESPDDLENIPERKNFDTYMTRTTDHGETWNDPVSITDQLNGEFVVPFGGGEWTEQGLLTCFYSCPEGEVQALISHDQGNTWEQTVTIAESPTDKDLTEPVPCTITDSKLIVFGRESMNGGFYAVRSHDGGSTWEEPVFFNPTNADAPKPIWIKKTGPNQLTGVWGDRDDLYIHMVSMSAQLAWQDPTALADEPRKRIHKHIGTSETASYWEGNAGDFGYPRFVQLGPSQSDIIVTFYDGPPWPDIWQMSLY
jgi:hypothetical protein